MIETAARELARAPGRTARAARRDRRRRARRRGRVPRRDLPARHAVHPGPDDARRPDRFVDRRQDRRRPARGQEPRRRVPPAARRSSSTSRCSRTLPERQLRAALGEAVKMAALGDERLFELLEATGAGDRPRRRRRPSSRAPSPRSSSGPAGPRSRSSSPTSASAARPAAGSRSTSATRWATRSRRPAGYGDLLHGEAVAYGLRAAVRIGLEVGVTPPERAPPGSSGCSTRSGSRPSPLPYSLEAVLGHLASRQEARRRAASAGSSRPRTASSSATTSRPTSSKRPAAGLLAAAAASRR